MKLYDEQKTFNIEHFTKDFLVYHKPFYSDGCFVFNEKYLKRTTSIPAGDRWRLVTEMFYDTDIPDLHKIMVELAPKDPDDKKLIPCRIESTLKGIHNFSHICQMFSYKIDGEERTILVDVDYLEYLDVKRCLFRVIASPIGMIVIYDIHSSELIGLILPVV